MDISESKSPNTKAATPLTSMCCYHLQGRCKKANHCPNSHEDRQQPCEYGARCRLGHFSRGTAPPASSKATLPIAEGPAARHGRIGLYMTPPSAVPVHIPDTVLTGTLPEMEHWILGLQPVHLAGSPYPSPQVLLDVIRAAHTSDVAQSCIRSCALDPSEALAWGMWSADCPAVFKELGRAIRENDTKALAPFATFISWLHRGAAKLPTHDGIVYRAWDTKDHTVSYVAGKPVHYAQFSACSVELTQHQLNTFGKGRGALLVLDVIGARHVSALSLFPHEGEVMLLPGWRGTVQGSIDDDSRRLVGLL